MPIAIKKIKVSPSIKKLFSDSLRLKMRKKEATISWYISGMQDPPIYSYKRKLIGKFIKGISADVFIETGTFVGDTTEWARTRFKDVYSIELDRGMAENARIRFATYSNVHLFEGDSALKLNEALKHVSGRAVFWLDGHYSGGGTALADIETPILEELRTIFAHPFKDHLILIDDARCFDGTHDYPTLEGLKKFILKNRPSAQIEVVRDIIVIRNLS